MRPLVTLWTTAFAVAAVGTWMLYDAGWGINALAWTATAVASLLICAGQAGRLSSSLIVALGLALLLASGVAITADGASQLWLAVAVLVLLSIATLLAQDGRADRVDALFMARATLVAAGRCLTEAGRRVPELTDGLSSERSRPWVRGVLVALPVLVLFGLLLADADPVFGTLRQSLRETLETWDFAPRLVFFGALLTAAVGAGGLALRGPASALPVIVPRRAQPALGLIERLIVLVSVATLFAVFLGLQLSYLFGNTPAVAGSGITFAEYARRGFNELTVVATLCTLVVVALGQPSERRRSALITRLVALALVGESLLLLVSAFRRVWLYETAYGFTTTRLYAQTYMIWMASVLLMLSAELLRGLDSRRLARRTAGLAALALAALAYWNHEAWIVRVNVERATHTGTLDATYLVQGLSLNALPALVSAQASSPEAVAAPLRQALNTRYAGARGRSCRWFEANLRQAQAVRALEGAGLATDTRPVRNGCLRLDARP